MRWWIAAFVIVIAAASVMLFAPRLLFVPTEAARLYDSNGEGWLSQLEAAERRGIAVCRDSGSFNPLSYSHTLKAYECEFQDRWGRNANLRLAFIQCSPTTVVFQYRRLTAFRVEESEMHEIGAAPCPDDVTPFVGEWD